MFKSKMMLCLTLAYSVWLASPSAGQQAFEYEEQITALAQPYLESNKFQAASVGIYLKGKTWTFHFGTISPDNPSLPNEETIYEIGSITKVFTSLLLADAVENAGSMKLDQAIGTLLPELDEANPDVGTAVTLKQLSHHNSGLPRMPTNIRPADPNDPFAGYDRKMLHEFLMTAKLSEGAGTKYEYSNLAVGLLGDLLAANSKVDYGSLLQTQIFEPLAMNDSAVDVNQENLQRLAPPFNSALIPDYSWHFDALAGAGAIRSTTNDMLKFIRANIDPPKNEVGRAIELAWEQQLPASAGRLAMGLGWMIAGDGSTRWHNGQTGGYQSMLLVSRKLDAGVILLCNTAGSETDGLAESIFQTIVGMKVAPRTFDSDVQIDPETIQRLIGTYQLAPSVLMAVTAKESRLMVQITGQQALRVFPESDTVWNYRDVKAQLVFELPEKGPASKVTLHQNGRVLPAPRK